jgi:hypothetical protein
MARVLLPLVTLDLLQGVLECREKCFHALCHSIWVARHVDDLKNITDTHDQQLGGPNARNCPILSFSCQGISTY